MVSPKFLVPGEDQEVSCTAHNIFPPGPDILSFALLLGEQSLEGAQALEPEQEEETQGAEVTTLFRMTQRWLLPSLETPAPPVLYCQATMKILDLVLTRKRELPGKSSGFHLPLGSAALELGPGLLVPTWTFPSESVRVSAR